MSTVLLPSLKTVASLLVFRVKSVSLVLVTVTQLTG